VGGKGSTLSPLCTSFLAVGGFKKGARARPRSFFVVVVSLWRRRVIDMIRKRKDPRRRRLALTQSTPAGVVDRVPPQLTLAPAPRSRYREEFDELERLGRGGFGSVWKVRNKLDGCVYAIKRIRFHFRGAMVGCTLNRKLHREVKTLAQLDHPNIVRYHIAWIETAATGTDGGGSTEDGRKGGGKERGGGGDKEGLKRATSVPDIPNDSASEGEDGEEEDEEEEEEDDDDDDDEEDDEEDAMGMEESASGADGELGAIKSDEEQLESELRRKAAMPADGGDDDLPFEWDPPP
jgi:hypothetical protein